MCILDTYELSLRWNCSKQHILKLVSDKKLNYFKRFEKSGYYIYSLDEIKKAEEVLRYKVMRRYGLPQFMQEEFKNAI